MNKFTIGNYYVVLFAGMTNFTPGTVVKLIGKRDFYGTVAYIFEDFYGFRQQSLDQQDFYPISNKVAIKRMCSELVSELLSLRK